MSFPDRSPLRVRFVEGPEGGFREQEFDLLDATQLLGVYMQFANGDVDGTRFDAESTEGLDVVRGIATGAGACRLLDHMEACQLGLAREGYDCFRQGQSMSVLISIGPRPELFGREPTHE